MKRLQIRGLFWEWIRRQHKAPTHASGDRGCPKEATECTVAVQSVRGVHGKVNPEAERIFVTFFVLP